MNSPAKELPMHVHLNINSPQIVPAQEPIIAAFCGAKGHGKDTAAQVLIDKYDFKKVSFADGLRKTVCTALRVDEEWFLDPDKKEEIDPRTGRSRRYWLQYIGTEGFRSLWDSVWVEWWKAEIIEKGYSRVVTTDLRFPNEREAVKEFNTHVFRVTNPRKPINNDAHASELHYRNFKVDTEILNGGTIAELQEVTESAVCIAFGLATPSNWRN